MNVCASCLQSFVNIPPFLLFPSNQNYAPVSRHDDVSQSTRNSYILTCTRSIAMSSLPQGGEMRHGSSSSLTSPTEPMAMHRARRNSSGTSGSPSSVRSVSFSPETSGRIISSRHDMTEDEKAAAWWTEDEMKASQQDLIKSVFFARRGQLTSESGQHDDDALCIRGLEHLVSPQRLREAQDQRNLLIDGVLNEQDRRWRLGDDRVVDPEALRAISKDFSREDVARAIDLADSDADFVRNLR